MWIRLINKIASINEVAGLEINISKDGPEVKSLTVLKRQNKKVIITQRKRDLKLDELSQEIVTLIPLALTISGKGILYRKTSYGDKEEAATILHRILPNSNVDEFYLQQLPTSGNEALVAVSRKNIINEIIASLQSQGYQVISITIGPFTITPVLPLVTKEDPDTILQLNNHSLVIKNNVINDIQAPVEQPVDYTIQIEDQVIEKVHLLSFSTALHAFLRNGLFEIDTLTDHNESSSQAFKAGKAFKSAGVFLLAFFFLILVINYFLFNHYSKKSQALAGEMYLKQDQLTRMEQLEKQLNERMAFFETAGLLSKSKSSFYADELAKDLPASIQFTQLNFNPKVKSTDPDSRIAFKSRTIVVNGICQKSFDLNQWIKSLKKKSWLKAVTLLNYQQEGAQPGEFSLEIETIE